ncbi:Stp1/IreP family PP2C-type Ser/Thr phosphatase [Oceanobacillus halotolerans]|uniref:Stp1/IreP family PP2C-type Ser/Thr phosphatase n=1 Tax=Oceanobacillus halotolerans TaxID=2663380 RepID=UPI0013DCFD66|nr:Stp1/IreP family PP2C-type Ser/Thr phosphatase [Oceanobacillus halotolerans]
MRGQFFTDRGQIRSHNEDAGGIFYNKDGQLLALVADGMGGHKAGDVASEMATSLVQTNWEECNGIDEPEKAEIWISELLQKVNQKIYEEATQNKDCQGMGTTIVVVICTKEFLTIAHVGDSRCYLWSQEDFIQLTEDHSLVNELVRKGEISKDDAEYHPRKNVLLKALGTEQEIKPDIQSITWENGNKLLLCSDGLTNKLVDTELEEYLALNEAISTIGKTMVEQANERGGEDNISLVLVFHDWTEKEGDNLC